MVSLSDGTVEVRALVRWALSVTRLGVRFERLRSRELSYGSAGFHSFLDARIGVDLKIEVATRGFGELR